MSTDKEYPARVKAAVDEIYGKTLTACPVPIINWPPLERRVAVIMIERDILKNLGTFKKPVWHWNSELAPTDTLYKSLLDAVRKKTAAVNQRYAEKKAKAKAAAKTEDPAAGPAEGTTLRRATLRDYTAQDLWNELKRRGVQVGPDGRLFIKIELD